MISYRKEAMNEFKYLSLFSIWSAVQQGVIAFMEVFWSSVTSELIKLVTRGLARIRNPVRGGIDLIVTCISYWALVVICTDGKIPILADDMMVLNQLNICSGRELSLHKFSAFAIYQFYYISIIRLVSSAMQVLAQLLAKFGMFLRKR